MDYYHLNLNHLVKHPIRIKGFDILASIAPFDSYKELSVYFFDYIEGETEITSILTSPIFLIDKKISDLFVLYQPNMQMKGIQLFSTDPDEKKKAVLYYLPDIPKIDCLSDKVRINPNGTINEILLNKDKVPEYPIFMLERIAEQKVIINEDVAESLLRRNLYGIGLKKIEIV